MEIQEREISRNCLLKLVCRIYKEYNIYELAIQLSLKREPKNKEELEKASAHIM